LRDVMNATFGADRSPEFKKARAVIEKYLDLVDNADVDHYDDDNDDRSVPTIGRMTHGDIARHIREYDLTDYLNHAAAMLDKIAGMGEAMTQEGSDNYMWQEVGDEDDQRQLKRMAERVVKMYKHYGETSASDEEIMSVLDDVIREFVPQVGKMNNVAPVSQAFFDKLPLKNVEPEYDDDGEEIEPENDPKSDMHDAIWPMVKITASAEKGDTSSYGYKVHPMMNKESTQESAELEAIKRLSGIAKGIGF